MSETIHIKDLADRSAKEIFSVFGWKKCGPTDYKWQCVELEKQHKKISKQHPSDVVFSYHDPYSGKRVYVNCDMKSYARSTITAYNPKSDILSLCQSVECAQKSDMFHRLYIYEGEPWNVEGLLFLYNHDGEYDKDFGTLMAKIPHKTKSPGMQRIFVLGPERIQKLYSVAKDIDSQIQANRRDGQYTDSGFWAPDLNVSKVIGSKIGAATLDMVTGPWLIHLILKDSGVKAYYVYCLEEEPSREDFKYLIDALLDFQMLDDFGSVTICIIGGDSAAITAFGTARTDYANENHGVTDDSLTLFHKRLEKIQFASVPTFKPTFFELELALKNG